MSGLTAPALPPYDANLVKAALDRLDHTAHTHERRWGIGRLRLLVDDILRAKFDRQARLLDDALWVRPGIPPADGRTILAHIDAMERGWQKLDLQATINGHQPMPPTWLETVGPDGKLFIVAADNADASLLAQQAAGRQATVFTIEEVGRLLTAWPDIARVKATFDGARVTEVRAKRPPDWATGDELPW